MILGVLIVTITYVLVNLAYMMLLPLPRDSPTASGSRGMPWPVSFLSGGRLMAMIIAISVFGTIAIYTMSAPRIYYAMAQDGVFFKGLSKNSSPV